jgi:HTH-type transcriptional regulator / antitoxin HigA
MDIKPIHNGQDYETALSEIDQIFDAQPGTEEADRLDILLTLVEVYEAKHYAIPLPDPIEAIYFHMDRLGLTRKDLEPFIGSRARVSEILNKKRPLTLSMIRKLHKGLEISMEILAQDYPVEKPFSVAPVNYYITMPSDFLPEEAKISTGGNLILRVQPSVPIPSENYNHFSLADTTGTFKDYLLQNINAVINPMAHQSAFKEMLQ